MKAYRAYLFDLDGTLIDTAPDLHDALVRSLADIGCKAPPEQATRDFIGHGARFLIEQALEAAGNPPGTEIDALHQAFLKYYAKHIADRSSPYPTVEGTLAKLTEQGAKLAVVTNKPERLSRQLLETLGMTGYFQSIVGGDTAEQPKPHPAPVLLACTELSVAIDDVLFVGDSTTDVNAARAAGCDVVCVPYGYRHGVAPKNLGADDIIENFSQLIA